jgi:hypothetical protein
MHLEFILLAVKPEASGLFRKAALIAVLLLQLGVNPGNVFCPNITCLTFLTQFSFYPWS